MKILLKVFVLSIFLVTVGYVYAHQVDEYEVVFVREYKEYGWKEYGADAVKLSQPIQTLVGFYLVEYRLSPTQLTITKLLGARPPFRTVLSTTSLSRVQRQIAQRAVHAINPNTIQQLCDAVISDDGFHLDVNLTKAEGKKNFRWNGNYVRELVELVNVINEVSPNKYRFYKLGQQEAFKKSLLRTTDAP